MMYVGETTIMPSGADFPQLSNSKFNDARERNRFCIEVSCQSSALHVMYPFLFRILSKLISMSRDALPRRDYIR